MFTEILAAILIALLFINIFDNYKNRKSSFPPGPWIFPVVGTLPQIIAKGRKQAHVALDKLAKQYGEIMFVKLGSMEEGIQTVILSSFEAAREICSKDCVLGRELNSFTATRAYPDQRDLGLAFGSGDTCKNTRRFVIRNLREFGFGKKQVMEDVILEQINMTMAAIDDKIQLTKNILDMSDGFPISVINMLWYFVSGKTFAHEDERCSQLLEIVRDIARSGALAGGVGTTFPSIGNLFPERSGRNQWEKRHRMLLDFLQETVDSHKATLDFNVEPNSLIDSFLYGEAKSKGSEDDIFSIRNIKVTLMDLIMGGAETTNNALNFGILYMVRFPEVQSKVRQELNNVFPGGVPCNLKLKDEIPYTQAVILEILRKACIIPVTPPRFATDDIAYNGYKIKKNTGIIVNQYSIVSDEKIWGDPENFRPERYLTPERKIDSRLAERTAAFGFGKRICPGQTLAESVLYLCFTTLVHNYEIKPVPNEPLPTLEPTASFSLAPRPYKIHITKVVY